MTMLSIAVNGLFLLKLTIQANRLYLDSREIFSLVAKNDATFAPHFRRYQYEEDCRTPRTGGHEEGCPSDDSDSEGIKRQDRGDRSTLRCGVAQDRKRMSQGILRVR